MRTGNSFRLRAVRLIMTSLHIAVEVQLLKPANKFAEALVWRAITIAVQWRLWMHNRGEAKARRIAGSAQRQTQQAEEALQAWEEWNS